MVVGSFTVGAVVFTVVVGCSWVCHYQQLLDVTLEEKKWKRSMSAEATVNFTLLEIDKVQFFQVWQRERSLRNCNNGDISQIHKSCGQYRILSTLLELGTKQDTVSDSIQI